MNKALLRLLNAEESGVLCIEGLKKEIQDTITRKEANKNEHPEWVEFYDQEIKEYKDKIKEYENALKYIRKEIKEYMSFIME